MFLETFTQDENICRIFNSSRDGVIIINNERKIVFINDVARNILGYDESEAIGARCKRITVGAECETDCPFTKAQEINEDVRGIPTWYHTKSGHRVACRTNAILIRNDKGEILGAAEIFSDITEIKNINLSEKGDRYGMIGSTHSMKEVYNLIDMVSPTDSTVLVTGESGTGKELIANAIQVHSARSGRPFIKINCAALNEGVLESELFGHVRGAYTGAVSDKMGRFEMAHGGTLFLDEVAEIPQTVQVKLLRILQEGEMERVGSGKTLHVDVRLIAATNQDIKKAIEEKKFRLDLYYRLNVMRIELPPLRERKADIPRLVDHFIKKFSGRVGFKQVKGISADAMRFLLGYRFPGNIRELENIVEHAMIRVEGDYITLDHFPNEIKNPHSGSSQLVQIRVPLQQAERDTIIKALDENSWKMSKAAQSLGVSRVTLWRKMRKYQIEDIGRL